MTIELAPAAEAALARIVSMSDRSREEIVTQAVENYATWLAYETARVEEARAEIAAGNFIEHDALFDELEKRYAE